MGAGPKLESSAKTGSALDSSLSDPKNEVIRSTAVESPEFKDE